MNRGMPKAKPPPFGTIVYNSQTLPHIKIGETPVNLTAALPSPGFFNMIVTAGKCSYAHCRTAPTDPLDYIPMRQSLNVRIGEDGSPRPPVWLRATGGGDAVLVPHRLD